MGGLGRWREEEEERKKREKERLRREEKKRKKKLKKKEKRRQKRNQERIEELIVVQTGERLLGSLKRNRKKWKKLGVSKEVWRWLEEGAPLLFEKRKRPQPRRVRVVRGDKRANEVLRKFVEEQEEEGWVEKTRVRPEVISPIFAIPKKEKGKWRVIVDLRHVNKAQRAPKFRNENFEDLGVMLKAGEYMIKADIKSGFHHMEMKEEHKVLEKSRKHLERSGGCWSSGIS